jgi:hypothetical protein
MVLVLLMPVCVLAALLRLVAIRPGLRPQCRTWIG